jgi:hypothetical protein
VKTVKVTEVFRAGEVGALDNITDSILNELINRETEELFDADVSAELATGLVEVSVVSVGSDFSEAVSRASLAIHRAIETTGMKVAFDKQSERSDVVVPA